MKFSANHSRINRIIDGLTTNRITDFETEGASPNLRKTMNAFNPLFNMSARVGNHIQILI